MSSILSSLQTGVSGLNAQSDAIGHISNNLSNARTTGYKTVDTEFTNLVTNSNARTHDPGAVKANPAYRNGQQGDISQSSQSTHMSISGNGFFTVKQAQQVTQNDVTFEDQNLYTRRGDFEVNRQGFLTNGANNYLQGKRVLDQDSRQTADQLQAVNISQGGLGLEPKKTSEVAYNANLPGDAQKANASDFFKTDTDGRAQLSEVTFGASGRIQEGDQFVLDVEGIRFEYTAAGGESLGTIGNVFQQAVNSGSAASPGSMTIKDVASGSTPVAAGPNATQIDPEDLPNVTAELVPGEPGKMRLTKTQNTGGGTADPGGKFDLSVSQTKDPLGQIAETTKVNTTDNADSGTNPIINGGGPNDGTDQIANGDTFTITVDGRSVTYSAATPSGPTPNETVEDAVKYMANAINGFASPGALGNVSGVGAVEGVTATADGATLKLQSNTAGDPIGDVSFEATGGGAASSELSTASGELGRSDDDRVADLPPSSSISAGDVYTLTVNNNTVAYKAGTGDGRPEVIDGLVQAANNTGRGQFGNGFYYGLQGGSALTAKTNAGNIARVDVATDSDGNDELVVEDNTAPEEPFSARLTGPSGNIKFRDINDNRSGDAVFANQTTVREAVSVGTAATRELKNLGSLGINEAIRVGDGFQTGEDFDSSEDFYTTKDKFLENTVSGGSTTMYGKDGTEYDVQFRWMYRGKDPISGEDQWQMYYKDPAFQNEGGVGVDASNGNGNTHWVPALGFEGATFKDGKLTSRAEFEGNRSITFTQGDKKPLQVANFSFLNPDGSSGLTNFADEKTSITRLEQNGYQAGSVTDIRVDDEGFVVSEFDNGEQRSLYEVTVSVFSDPNALRRTDGTAFKSTTQSGTPRLESEGRNGAGDIQGSTLEGSTTEIAESFTEMIEAQRIYTANTRVITTADQMTQQTLQLKQ